MSESNYIPGPWESTRQLISAAPDLLAALENLVGAVSHLDPCPGSLEITEAAIKKAKGLE